MIDSAFPIIATPDLDRALGFYRDVLGGTVSYTFPPDGPPAYVGVDLGVSHVGLGHDPSLGLADEQRITLWVYTTDCDAVVDAVREAGGTVLEEPVDQPWVNVWLWTPRPGWQSHRCWRCARRRGRSRTAERGLTSTPHVVLRPRLFARVRPGAVQRGTARRRRQRGGHEGAAAGTATVPSMRAGLRSISRCSTTLTCRRLPRRPVTDHPFVDLEGAARRPRQAVPGRHVRRSRNRTVRPAHGDPGAHPRR